MNNDGFSEQARGIMKAVSYFAKLDDAALASVERAAIRRNYDAEQVILIEGEPCAGLYIVESGWLKAVRIGLDGREQVLQTLKPGETFNAISVFTDAPNQATVAALEPSVVWMVRRDILLKLMEEYPSLARSGAGWQGAVPDPPGGGLVPAFGGGASRAALVGTGGGRVSPAPTVGDASRNGLPPRHRSRRSQPRLAKIGGRGNDPRGASPDPDFG